LRWLRYFVNSTLGMKVLVGLSGLFLCGFLVTHLAGNLLLFKGAEDYNAYAHALHANPLLPIAEVVLFVGFVVHVALTIALVLRSRRARPSRYAGLRTKRDKPWFSSSKTMAVTGIFVFVFIALHLADFRFGVTQPGALGEMEFDRTVRILQNPLTAVVYVLGSLFVGYHVNHGFQSAFQSLGANHPKFSPLIKGVGVIFSVVVALGFASFPIWANVVR
jgi:succinate dehydrogenase / fumarate reductase cytochrome b subunit